MNEYEERQERRRDRLETAADNAEAEASRRFKAADQMAGMMNGQPILIGHHSEKRHRRDIERMHNHGPKGLEAHKNAERLRQKAAAVGSGGISSDDPEAPTKLEAKLAGLEATIQQMKDLNKAWRKAGKPRASLEKNDLHGSVDLDGPNWQALGLAIGEPMRDKLKRMMAGDFMHRPPFTYEITNRGAEVRRLKQRIEQLEAAAGAEHVEETHDGITLEEDPTDNRIRLFFPGKPSAETRAYLKSRGFRWNRTLSAWQRQLSNAARYAAREVLTYTKGERSTSAQLTDEARGLK